MVEAIGLTPGRSTDLERPFGKDRVCGVVADGRARGMIAQVRRGLRSTKTLELRLDYLRDARERSAFLSWLARNQAPAVFLATCRSRKGGGRFAGSRQAQLEILARAAAAGCRWCDLEIEVARHYKPDELKKLLPGARVLVSYHDFQRTPKNLQKVANDLRARGTNAVKVAAQCHSISDVVRVCGLANGRRDVVVVPMGDAGIPGRVLSLRAGSQMSYAAVEQATAPGQISLADMQELYRASRITSRTRVYGVIGNPIGHSLSPLLHNTAFRERQADAVFVPFLVRDLRDFLGAVEPFGIRGFAVTIPHKETILRRLDDCDPLAARIGAVNTVVVRGGGRLYGYNTD
ncbi:MAG: type I 3-dehydroquinate dehydratase, partial [Bryobacteraceae bacterium]